MTDQADRAPGSGVVEALEAQQAELAGYVAGASAEQLVRPSRCPGWSVADVLLHLGQTNEMAVASVEGRLPEFVAEAASGMEPGGSVDAWADQLVERERGDPAASRDRWLTSAADQHRAFSTTDPAARVQWVAGDMAARSLATTRLTETWIHAVDVAVAFGPEPAPTDRLWHTARLVWRTVPYAFMRSGLEPPGSVRFELVAPNGSTWTFGDQDDAAATVLRGTARDLCTVAGQRAVASETGLSASGPSAGELLRLVRTFA